MLEVGWATALGAMGLMARLSQAETEAMQDLVHRTIQANPGIGMAELCRTLDLHWQSMYLYVGRLKKAGHVKVKRQGTRAFLYPAGMSIPRAAPKVEPQLSGQARKVALHMVRHPGLDAAEYQERLMLSRRMTYYYIKRFVDEGLFTSKQRDRYVGLEPTPKLLRLLNH